MANCLECNIAKPINTCTDTLVLCTAISGTHYGVIEDVTTGRKTRFAVTSSGGNYQMDTSDYTFNPESLYRAWLVNQSTTNYDEKLTITVDSVSVTCVQFNTQWVFDSTGAKVTGATSSIQL